MSDRARVRINLGQREIEIEGSEAFVGSYAERLEALLESFTAAGEAFAALPENGAAGEPILPDQAIPVATSAAPDLGSFGEYMTRLPPTATEVDRMLAAGYWVQRQATDDAFATGEANRRLAEQGIKIGNPSQCVKQSVLARRVFSVQRGRFRVSQIGRAHLRHIIGPMIPP